MRKYLLTGVAVLSVFISCDNRKAVKSVIHKKNITAKNKSPKEANINPEDLSRFIPHTFAAFDTIYGDLNKDGLKDCVLIIKATDKSKIVDVAYQGKKDRNRRGIIILFNKKNHYETVSKNYDCFSSENEDGGVYMPPELDIEIKDEKLYINYVHGRYGSWGYTFRFQNGDFGLIGFDANEDTGPRTDEIVSLNFLTGKKIINENINQEGNDGEEVFKETVKVLPVHRLTRLSGIKDFDELDFLINGSKKQ